MRRLAITGATLLLCALAVCAGRVAPARATETLSPLTPFQELEELGSSSTYTDAWASIIRNVGTYGSQVDGILGAQSATEAAGLTGELAEGGAAAGFLPAIPGVGWIAAGAAVTYVGYRLIRHYADGSPDQTTTIYLDPQLVLALHCTWGQAAPKPASGWQAFGSDRVACTDGNTVGESGLEQWWLAKWELVTKSTTNPDYCRPTDAMGTQCYVLRLETKSWNSVSGTAVWPNGLNDSGWPDYYEGDWDQCSAAIAAGGFDGAANGCWWALSGGGWSTRKLEGDAQAITLTQKAIAAQGYRGSTVYRVHYTTKPPFLGSGNAATYSYSDVLPLAGAYAAVDHVGTHTGDPSTSDVTVTVPTTAGHTDQTVRDSLAPFSSTCGEAFVNAALAPATYSYPANCYTTGAGAAAGGFAAVQQLRIPSPDAGETYADYVARLQALGWLGTATKVVADPVNEDACCGPDGVIRVRSGSSVYTTSSWPSSSVYVDPNSALTITVNPSDAPAGDGTGTSGGGGGGSIDWTPLTDLTFGCKFPFGFICYAEGVNGWFNVAPSAPDFTIHIPAFETGVGVVGPFDYGPIDLGYLSTYMGWIRALLAVTITVGFVYRLASKLLGFDAAGDPGAAFDDGYMGPG